jgi:hypothetical protein
VKVYKASKLTTPPSSEDEFVEVVLIKKIITRKRSDLSIIREETIETKLVIGKDHLLTLFVNKYITKDPMGRIPVSVLRECFVDFLRSNRQRLWSNREFNIRFEAFYDVQRETKYIPELKTTMKVWEGVRFKN